MTHLPSALAQWFAGKGWTPRRYQLDMLKAARDGRHALLTAPTGSGKTLSGFLPSLVDLIESPAQGLHTLYISPLKALAVDVRRNLLSPIEEMGLDIRVETRTGDTPSDRKARQRANPPQMLLTTPESLSLLLSYSDSFQLFAGLKTVIVDEVHAFAPHKRGDLLSLSLARLQAIAPEMRRVALSATVPEPDAYRAWMAPGGDKALVTHVEGDQGAPPHIEIALPEGEIPWGGHSARYAARQVMAEIETHEMTLVFCNTRGLAELIFQDLWAENALKLPIGIHHGSLDIEARRKVERAMAEGRLRGLVATASLDLGVDWGNIDCVIQMGAPKGASRLMQRIGRANHRLDEPSEAIIVPGNRFEYLEAQAAIDAIGQGACDGEPFRPGGLDVLAQHIMGIACARPFDEQAMLDEIRSATPYRGLDAETFARVLDLVATGGYALRAYDRFRRLSRTAEGAWRVTHPRFAALHRFNAGVIVDSPMLAVRFRNGRRLGMLDESFAAGLSPGDCFFFAGMSLEVASVEATDLFVRATTRRARIPSYSGTRMPLSTHLADRVRAFLHDRREWTRFPPDVHQWLAMQVRRSALPAPDQLLVESFPRNGANYMVIHSFEGWNAHQSFGMLVTRRMETLGLQPLGFVASDYALAVWSLKPAPDPRALLSPDILTHEFIDWVEKSALLKRAFREVAVISGLVERQHPGKRKSGRQLTISTDLIYDVLRKYEPDHMLVQAAWADARARMTDIGRLGALLDRAATGIVHKTLPTVSPLAVPVLVLIGRESVAGADTDDLILAEAESLIRDAMSS